MVQPECMMKRPKRKEKRKTKKPYSGKLGIHLDHPRRRIKTQMLHGGSLRGIVLMFKFHKNRLSGFRDVGGRNVFSVTLAVGLYKSLYYHTSRDAML